MHPWFSHYIEAVKHNWEVAIYYYKESNYKYPEKEIKVVDEACVYITIKKCPNGCFDIRRRDIGKKSQLNFKMVNSSILYNGKSRHKR